MCYNQYNSTKQKYNQFYLNNIYYSKCKIKYSKERIAITKLLLHSDSFTSILGKRTSQCGRSLFISTSRCEYSKKYYTTRKSFIMYINVTTVAQKTDTKCKMCVASFFCIKLTLDLTV